MRVPLGLMLCLVLVLSSCRSTRPPRIEICIADGYGGGDCIEKDDKRIVKTPSQLKNYWMTNPEDMAAFSAWCYETTPYVAGKAMKRIEGEIK